MSLYRVSSKGSALFALALFCSHARAATITVDCGSATDSNFTGGSPFTIIPLVPPGTGDLTLRYGQTFSYTFPADNIPYIVTFQFLEPCGGSNCSAGQITAAGQRVFSVTINDEIKLPAFDVFAAAGGSLMAINRSVIAVAADKTLRIVFTSQIRTAVVSSIAFRPLYDVILDQSSITARSIIDDKCTRCHGVDGPWLDTAGVWHPFPSDSLLGFANTRKEVGDLDLRTRASILQGGSRGPAIIPKNGAASRMYRYAAFLPAVPPTLADVARLNAANGDLKQMPPYAYGISADPTGEAIDRFLSLSPTVELTPRQLAAVKFWIDLGAP
jgi:Malectin domain